MFGSLIVYLIAVVIGFALGLAVRPAGRRALLTLGIAGVVSGAIGALEFSQYFSVGESAEAALFVGLAAAWCFVFTVVGFGFGAGVRWFVAATVRAFRGE
jgi:hypothetical protein